MKKFAIVVLIMIITIFSVISLMGCSGNAYETNGDPDDRAVRIAFVIIGIVSLVISIIVLVKRKSRLNGKIIHLMKIKRNPKQDELFWKSYAFMEYAGYVKKAKKSMYVRYVLGGIITIVGIFISGFVSGWAGAFIVGTGTVLSYVIDAIIAVLRGNTKSAQYSKTALDWASHNCIKCGGNAEIINSKFKRTDSETREVVVENGRYPEVGEVLKVINKWNENRKKWKKLRLLE
ncbi:MAG: hypothetical protein FWE22_08190 [Firmicutes bacterium]|nr:hypothetical protein [Bacillota bacterium]